jgi:hypothetical protein
MWKEPQPISVAVFWAWFSTSVSILKWEKNANQTSLTNLALENIFHSKQHDRLTKFDREQNTELTNATFNSPSVPFLS